MGPQVKAVFILSEVGEWGNISGKHSIRNVPIKEITSRNTMEQHSLG